MSDVSFVGAVSAKDFTLERRAPEPSVQKPQAEQPREQKAAQDPQLLNKTKVMTEFRSAFQVTYTFIDPNTDQVVARWPVTPPVNDNAPGAHLKQTL
jgi:hypothetical protein